MHCHFKVHTTWGLKMVWIVLDGQLPNEKFPPPPSDLPKCWSLVRFICVALESWGNFLLLAIPFFLFIFLILFPQLFRRIKGLDYSILSLSWCFRSFGNFLGHWWSLIWTLWVMLIILRICKIQGYFCLNNDKNYSKVWFVIFFFQTLQVGCWIFSGLYVKNFYTRVYIFIYIGRAQGYTHGM